MFVTCALLLCCSLGVFIEASPPKCKDGKFLDVQNQIYIGCEECVNDWMGCRECCKPTVAPLRPSSPPSQVLPISSPEDPDAHDQRILQTFLYGFVLFIVATVLFVLVIVVVKVTRERRAQAQCDQESRDRNTSNATDICEVYFEYDTNSAAEHDGSSGCHDDKKDLPISATNGSFEEDFDHELPSSNKKSDITTL